MLFVVASVGVFVIFKAYNCLYASQQKTKQVIANQSELQTVLRHFKKDTLKYKTARFLLEEIPLHHTAKHVELANKNHEIAFKLLHKKALEQLQLGVGERPQNKAVWEDNRQFKRKFKALIEAIEVADVALNVSDTATLHKEQLINHIDKAFENLDRSSLINNHDWQEFLETLLPYRYGDENLSMPKGAPEDLWKPILKGKVLHDIPLVTKTLGQYFKRIEKLTQGIKIGYDVGFYNILQWNTISCKQQTLIATQILNSIGIPTYIDNTPLWKNRDQGHIWCVSKTQNENFLPFSPWWQSVDSYLSAGAFHKNYFKRTSKVYRTVFAAQDHSAQNFKAEHEDVYPYFNTLFLKDVTNLYHDTAQITLALDTNSITPNAIAYLAIFSPKGWQPVGWSVIDKKSHKVVFTKVPKNTVYTVCSYAHNKLEVISEAFYVTSKGATVPIQPKHNVYTNLKLYRKYPDKERLTDYRYKLIGGQFQGANTPTFENPTCLYKFDSVPKNYIEQISIHTNKTYQYVRFLPKNNDQAGLAELGFYRKRSKSENTEVLDTVLRPYTFNRGGIKTKKHSNTVRLTGKYISNNKKATQKRLHVCFDGNMNTYTTDQWVGMDFETPQHVDYIRYAARNANNRITRGHLYELLYYDKGWVSFAKKKAAFNALEFTDVPEGTMYWLRNLTKGKEELPFMYIDGKQVFVNYDDCSFIETTN